MHSFPTPPGSVPKRKPNKSVTCVSHRITFRGSSLYTVPAEIMDTLTFSFQKIHNFLQKLCKWKHILVSTDVLIWFAEEHNKKLE